MSASQDMLCFMQLTGPRYDCWWCTDILFWFSSVSSEKFWDSVCRLFVFVTTLYQLQCLSRVDDRIISVI
jgi:hypothetical protein